MCRGSNTQYDWSLIPAVHALPWSNLKVLRTFHCRSCHFRKGTNPPSLSTVLLRQFNYISLILGSLGRYPLVKYVRLLGRVATVFESRDIPQWALFRKLTMSAALRGFAASRVSLRVLSLTRTAGWSRNLSLSSSKWNTDDITHTGQVTASHYSHSTRLAY